MLMTIEVFEPETGTPVVRHACCQTYLYIEQKGNGMEQLNELEKKIFAVIQKNRELQQQVSKLSSENLSLQEQCRQLETSLMSRSKSAESLEVEKASVKTTIEKLLKTINSLETNK
jgi:chromosome segregation ATPase